MHDVCLLDYCLSYIKSWLNDFYSEDNGSRCRCASTPLYKDWVVVSLINNNGDMCGNCVFCVAFDCWMSPEGRWCCQTIFGTTNVAIIMQLLEDGERLQVIPPILFLPPSVVNRI